MNEYQRFSTVFKIESAQEFEFLKDFLLINEQDLCNLDLIARIKQDYGIDISDEKDYFPGFSYELSEDKLWAYERNFGKMDILASLIRATFKKFRQDGYFSFCFSEGTHDMQVDSFGGGMMVVTADKIRFFEQEKLVTGKI